MAGVFSPLSPLLMRWQLLVLLGSTVCLLATSAPFDLDVGIPPGSPASWARRFPGITPARPLFPKTAASQALKGDAKKRAAEAAARGPRGTEVQSRKMEVDVRISTSFGVVRIITWDLVGHLPWVARSEPKPKRTITGPGGKATPLPRVSDALYWANMGALLRLLLHPQLVSEKELIVHLAEIGEPVLAVLDNAVGEEALSGACKKLRKMITAPRAATRPLEGTTPRETMLKRFLADELVEVYPYDPEGGFGQRFMLWAEELEPFLAEYVHHEDSFLRRNAVTALGRYRTDSAMVALADVAAKTTDQVCLMRALGAVGAYRSLRKPGPLLERLKNTKDPIEKVALVVALGRMGVAEAVPLFLELGRTKDSDLLQAVVAGLARIHHGRGDASVRKFARRIARAAHARPQRFRVKNESRAKADIPDGDRARGEVLEQLARILQVRVETGHKVATRFLLDLVSEGKRAGKAGPVLPRGLPPAASRVRSAVYLNSSLRKVHPPVQMLFLETLRLLGAAGTDALKTVAEDRSAEPSLRGHALAQMPVPDRGPLVVGMLESEDESAEMKIYALEILNNDGHKRIQELGLALLKECAKADIDKATPEERYLWTQALRALGKRNLLKVESLLPLLEHVEVRKPSHEALHQQVRRMVVQMVNDGAAGRSKARLRKQLDAILDLVIRHGLNPKISADTRDAARARVEGMMVGLRGHKGDVFFRNRLSRDILQYLLAVKMGFTLKARTEFKPVVLLEEQILLALGRTRSKEAGEALSRFLGDHPKSVLVPHACLALGISGQKAHARKLLPLLVCDDGFTRFCAYEALRHLTSKDYWADWMFGEMEERTTAAEQYVRCLNSKR